ncbi:MAG: hypothetical protein FJZ66_02340 [Bacteroidetes bacterium]|nr:hypothetical protein [Bacteroidota bacterium]
MENKKLEYIISTQLDVYLLSDIGQKSSIIPLMYITSNYMKTSSGKGLYTYYSNDIFDSNHEKIETNSFTINGITCELTDKELWLKNRYGDSSVVLNAVIKDRIGVEIELRFNQYSMKNTLNLRFKDLFDYIKLLSLVDTHKALEIVEFKNNQIKKLENKIAKLSKK